MPEWNRVGMPALALALGIIAGIAAAWFAFRGPAGDEDSMPMPDAKAVASKGRAGGAEAARAGPSSAERNRLARDGGEAGGGGFASRSPAQGRDAQERLMSAVYRGNVNDLRSALEEGSGTGSPLDLRLALSRAIDNGDSRIAGFLMENGAPVNGVGDGGYSMLMRAVMFGGYAAPLIVAALLDKGADAQYSVNGWTALAVAEAENDEALVEVLRKGGAVLDSEMSAKCMLLRACMTGDLESARAGLAQGASPDASTLHGGRAISLAASCLNAGIVRLLIEKGVQVNFPKGEWQPLTAAVSAPCGESRLEVIRLLLEAHADANAFGGCGGGKSPDLTPVQSAAKQGDVAALRLLLDHGGDSALRDSEGNTPLHLAVAEGRRWTAELLLDRGANANAKDGQGRTPLKVLAGRPDPDIEELLKRFGSR